MYDGLNQFYVQVMQAMFRSKTYGINILRLSHEDSKLWLHFLALINLDVTLLGVTVLSHTLDRNISAAYHLLLSHSKVVVHLPVKREVVGSSPTGKANVSFFLRTFS